LWFDVSGWGKRYEGAAPYLTSGAQVYVCGEQGEREHDGKTYKTLRLLDLQLIGGRQERAAKAETTTAPPADFDDDFPPF
jgi:single-strand DNA-binding protein